VKEDLNLSISRRMFDGSDSRNHLRSGVSSLKDLSLEDHA